jgi:predicted small metal-binding protein
LSGAHEAFPRGEDEVVKVINCMCGQSVQGDSDDEVLDKAEAHVAESHADMVGEFTRDRLRTMIEQV